MPDNEYPVANATEEVAKTIGKAIDLADKHSGFWYRLLGEPLEMASGLFTDKLRMIRWERRTRLIDRCEEILKQRKFEGKTRPVSLKLLLPIIDGGTLEDVDSLQDLWAQLLATAMDPRENTPRSAFADMINQLEPIDARVLALAYATYRISWENRNSKPTGTDWKYPQDVSIPATLLSKTLGLSAAQLSESLDNLVRLRCVDSFATSNAAMIDHTEDRTSASWNLEYICITTLGCTFVQACIPLDAAAP